MGDEITEKTVKEIIEDIIDAPNDNEYYIANIDDLDDIKRAYEKEIAEKDRKIDLLLTANKQITYSTKSREYNKPKLYKEDFEVFKSCYGCFSNGFDSKGKCYICHANKVIRLKDNSNYDKLPSKDMK